MEGDEENSSRGRGIDAFPNANSPQLLTHMMETLARGIRSTRGLQESLGIDQRTVRYYLQAGRWLGLLLDGSEPLLSPDGLAYVYAGSERPRHYARLVLNHPFVQQLLSHAGGRMPTTAQVAEVMRASAPDLADATLQRRASSVRGLIAPAMEPGLVPEADARDQLALPLSQAPKVAAPPPLSAIGGKVFNPDIYRYIACTLMDHGELTLGHVRGLLDRAGASDVAIGPYIDLALERGDAARLEERLVVTSSMAHHRHMLDSTASIILSDAGWRAHLTSVMSQPNEGSQVRIKGRYRLWDRRLFGHQMSPDTLEADLHVVLRDRSLSSWPICNGPGDLPAYTPRAFLLAWDQPGLAVALPPALAQLWEGLSGINRRLRNARHRADAVALPTPAYRPLRVHGGALHPGETLPRSIPDLRSLRTRLVMNSPYVAMVIALMLLHRNEGSRLSIRTTGGRWELRRYRQVLGAPLEILDGFARAMAWIPSRRPHGGLNDGAFLSLLERLRLVVLTDQRALLEEGFFHSMRQEAEEGQLHPQLTHLGARLSAYLDTLVQQDEG